MKRIGVMGCVHEQHNFLNSWMMDNVNDLDALVVTGDVANSKIPAINAHAFMDFCTWIDGWDIPVFQVPGNHEVSVEAGLVDLTAYNNITFLFHESVEFEGINIFGSPFTPAFGHGWAYNVKRTKLDEYWKVIPGNTDLLITHGPPKYILDITEDYSTGMLESVGDKALLNHVKRVQPKYHVFSHLHDEEKVLNNGIRTIGAQPTQFVNCSIVDLKHNFVNVPKIITI